MSACDSNNTSTELSIEDVENIESRSVDYGTSKQEVKDTLPEEIEVTLSNGDTRNVQLVWETDEYNRKEPGKYTFAGNFTVEEISENIKVKVTVKDSDETVSNVNELENVLKDLSSEDEIVVKLKNGEYKDHIKISDQHSFSELTLIAEEKQKAKITNGIEIYNSDNVKLIDFLIEGNGGNGINVDSSKNITITNNIIKDNEYFGILIKNSKSVVIENNEVKNNGLEEGFPGIQTNNSEVKMLNNKITGNKGNGISLVNESYAEILNGNEISNNNKRGVLLRQDWGSKKGPGSEAIIEDAEVIGNGLFGIESSYSEITIKNSVISNNGSRGFSIYNNSIAIIENNKISDHTNKEESPQGIGFNNSDVEIINNEISNNGIGLGYGGIDTTNYGENKIIDNNFENNEKQVVSYIENNDNYLLLKEIKNKNDFTPESEITTFELDNTIYRAIKPKQ